LYLFCSFHPPGAVFSYEPVDGPAFVPFFRHFCHFFFCFWGKKRRLSRFFI
jgi:hypothetical protein